MKNILLSAAVVAALASPALADGTATATSTAAATSTTAAAPAVGSKLLGTHVTIVAVNSDGTVKSITTDLEPWIGDDTTVITYTPGISVDDLSTQLGGYIPK